MKKIAILLINVGTPDKPEKKYVRRFLSQFLNDRYVIDIPWLLQKILVNFIIVPFRAKKSTNLYKKLWTENGSPLLIYLEGLATKLQKKVGEQYTVYAAMRYGNPSLKNTLNKIDKNRFDEIIVLPLYPQYATSTTLTTINKIKAITKKWQYKPNFRFIEQFYAHSSFIHAITEKIIQHNLKEYDHIIFSYHGLPLRQINKMHPHISCDNCSCEEKIPQHGYSCYKATCYETSRLLAREIKMEQKDYSVAFQSRLSKRWLTPFLDDSLKNLLAEGNRKILVVAPSFVADCLETIVEIEHEYQQMFLKLGGEKLTLVESQNDSDEWVRAVEEIVKG